MTDNIFLYMSNAEGMRMRLEASLSCTARHSKPDSPYQKKENRVGWLLLDTCEHVISNFVFDERLLEAHYASKLAMCLLAIRTKKEREIKSNVIKLRQK